MKRWVTIVLLTVFISVFLVSGYLLIDYLSYSQKEQGSFDELANIMQNAQQNKPNNQQNTTKPNGSTQNQPQSGGSGGEAAPEDPYGGLVGVTDPSTGEKVYMLPEFAELYTLNRDIVGWMTLEGTNLNYPVMHRPEDVDYYLNRDYYGEYSYRGCFYLQEVCSLDPHSDNVTIYGHNMSDGTMMAALHKYKKQDFWEEHKTITLNTLTEYREYEIVAVFRASVSVDTGFLYNLFVNAEDEAEFDAYIDKCKSLAFYDTGVDAQYGDKLITLSTCDRSITNGRLVVVAKLITEDTTAE